MPPVKTTAIAKTSDALPIQNMSDIASAGTLLAQANFLGTKNAGEGFVVMTVCRQTGMSLLEYQQKFHYRQGRFSMQAHAMLDSFVERGGTYKIIARSTEHAAIEFKKGDNIYLSELTWEQAQQEPFVYAGNENEQLAELKKPFAQRKLKNKYATPRARQQMLWARVVSDGVVVVDPGARMGYTPEETEDFATPGTAVEQVVDLATAQEKLNQAKQSAPAFAEQIKQSAPIVVEAEVIEAEVVAPAQKEKPVETPAPTPAAPQMDYTVCPNTDSMPAPLRGKAWATMDDNALKSALAAIVAGKYADLTAKHGEAIQSILQNRTQK